MGNEANDLRASSKLSFRENSETGGSRSSRRRSVALNFQDPKDLLMSVSTVVKNRSGTVLSRGMILKSDHFDTGVNPKSDIKLQGAPNFRMADINVCGVAQPTTSGIKTVLTLLRVQPGSSHTSKVLWISAREEPLIYIDERPFVIRDSTKALKHLDIYQGIRTHRLEQMEERLKRDIILERDRWAGLILVHDEPSDLTLVPEWVAVTKVQTPREVFAELSAEGFSVIYDRIPISPEEAPRDIQMDSFIKAVKGHPTMAPIVFNCGMGLGRTTCAMVIAIIIRRFKILQEQGTDHLKIFSRLNKPYNDENISMVELLQVLDQAFASSSMDRSAIDWALARSPVLSNLRESMNGKYRIVGQLGSLLGNGTELKELLDEAIDRCSLFVNLRKLILAHRLKHSVSGDESVLKRAVGCLERYLAVFALCSYLQETHEGKTNAVFSDWLISKPDVFNLLNRLSDTTASLSLFQPCDNISIFSSDIQARGLTAWGPHTDQPASELDKYVIKARKGAVLSQNTILKEDFWEQGTKITGEILSLKGASNFRQIPGYPVYGVAQPTLQGVKNVLEHIRHVENIVWINLREEPFIYINSVPYVLRDMDVTLRNLKSFRGITPQGLRTIESKLKKDVLDELKVYGEKILLHSETEGGKVTPVWQECCPSAVLSLNDAMKLIKMEMEVNETHMSMPSLYENVVELTYHRVPLTAEAAPDAEDFDHMIEILKTIRLENFAVVLNCQIGHGRSTTGTVMTILILRWLGMKLDVVPMLAKKNLTDRATNNFNYQATHSLLRVIRNGIECKHIVDQVIDCAATIINIRDSIEFFRQKRDKEPAGQRRDYYHARGVVSLERYFNLILFQNYLNNNEYSLGNDMISFKSWILQHPEFETIKEESLFNENFDPLVPVSELEPGDGIALTDEVLDAVNRRRGAVLSQGTIIKYDVFPGCQKQSLPDRIDGSPNYRLVTISNIMNIPKDPLAPDVVQSGKVCGVGMPSKAGIMSVLKHLNAGPQGESFAYWTSLREEPVLYIKGRPYVLRLFIDPIKNLVTTGINAARVESMEEQMKFDVVNELKVNNGRLLLHEERLEAWETVGEDEIETPLDVYTSVLKKGYNVDYLRIAITDELSPIPDVFNQLVTRILSVPAHGVPIFNCQMGRGRTTQGLVITSLMKLIVGNKAMHKMPELFLPDEDSESVDSSSLQLDAPVADNPIEKHYKTGMYKLILQLLAVLQYGTLAKSLVDKIIDGCQHMQNLRAAIYDFKKRLDSMDHGTKKYEVTLEMGCNYLVRYFYLIAFADYLLEIWAPSPTSPIAFSEWLDQRREIKNIVRNPTLEL